MIAFLRARATRGVEVVAHDCYRRTVRVNGTPAVLELRVVADRPHLCLALRPAAGLPLLGVAERAQRMFDLGADPVAIGAHLGRSPELSALVRRRPGLRVPGAWDGFELAVRAMLGGDRGANALAARLVTALGEPYDAGGGLTHLFPTAEALAEADLRPLGEKGRAVRALAGAVAAGELELEASRGLDEFVQRIRRVPGIDATTAQYVAMRACGEPDAFPAGDLLLRRAAGNGRPLAAGALSRRAEAWRPWRAYAAMYLWTR
jgi:AraC family transcriptional regulator of adaptative response / DNA-3-methyladenine glycosylase II